MGPNFEVPERGKTRTRKKQAIWSRGPLADPTSRGQIRPMITTELIPNIPNELFRM